MEVTLIAVALSISVAIPGAIAHQSIPEVVQKRGPVEQIVFTEYSPVDLPELVVKTDWIVQVYVTAGKGYLSDDQQRIYTDYSVQLLKDWRHSPQAKIQPGDTLTVRRPGGKVTVEGQIISSEENDFPEFSMGREYVLFLHQKENENVFTVSHGAQGAFEVANGHVKQVSTMFGTWNETQGEVSLERFGGMIAEHLTGPDKR